MNTVTIIGAKASRLALVRSGSLNIGYDYLANSPMVEHLYYTNNGIRQMMTAKTYDRLNRLTSIASVNAQSLPLSSFAYEYNAAGQRTQARLADGAFWRYEYDSLGQVKSGKKYWADGSPVAGQQFEYGFDDIGNRTSTRAGGDENGLNLRSASYSPNLLNQYVSRTVPGAIDVIGVSFATNAVTVNGQTAYRKGEYFRKELGVANASSPAWANINVSAAGQSTVSGYAFVPKTPEQFWYDYDGNLTNDGRWKLMWDAENRLVRMVSGTSVGPQQRIDFGYDTRSRRITKKVWNNSAGTGTPALDQRFIYDDWNLAAELNATNNAVIRSYVWGLDLSGSLQGAGGVGGLVALLDLSGGTNFCAYDGNGNVSVLVSATNSAVTAAYEYGPFGELLRANGPARGTNPFRFSTKYQDDESDLVYYGYRYYNPSTGKWTNRDLIQEKGGFNLYMFAENNAFSRVDALGASVIGGGTGSGYSWDYINGLLEQSKEEFHRKLSALCPASAVVSCAGDQVCTREACLVQAEVLTRDYEAYLKATFTAQFHRFGNILAFTPTWNIFIEHINERAEEAPYNGMKWVDFNMGFGLKCQGMQSLMSERFKAVMTPLRHSGMQCFKGAEVGNLISQTKAPHNWFAIYALANDDLRRIDVDVDPWYSAGGIISPKHRIFGEPKYFVPILW